MASVQLEMSLNKKRKRKKVTRRVVNVGCWNMRSLVEDEGGLETSRARKGKVKGAVEKRSALLCWELKHYNIYAAGISETKCFGANMYEVEGYTIFDVRTEAARARGGSEER